MCAAVSFALEPLENSKHLGFLKACDIVHDTYYHDGDVITLDTLWCKVPVLPDMPFTHNGSSILSAVGLNKELVAKSLD